MRGGHAELLAKRIPQARLVEPPGEDHLWYAGDVEALFDRIETFLTGARAHAGSGRVLTSARRAPRRRGRITRRRRRRLGRSHWRANRRPGRPGRDPCLGLRPAARCRVGDPLPQPGKTRAQGRPRGVGHPPGRIRCVTQRLRPDRAGRSVALRVVPGDRRAMTMQNPRPTVLEMRLARNRGFSGVVALDRENRLVHADPVAAERAQQELSSLHGLPRVQYVAGERIGSRPPPAHGMLLTSR